MLVIFLLEEGDEETWKNDNRAYGDYSSIFTIFEN